jgi:peptidoglycan L-alanyl-D-glutamate endopeptidase CwlK
MIDNITVERIKTLHPKVREEVHNIYLNEIVPALSGRAICRFAYTLRTDAEQAALYAQGRNGDKRPKVTNAAAGQSIHNYGLALDIVLLYDKDGNGTFETASWDMKTDFDGDKKADWMEVVAILKKHGWTWGGDWVKFKDAPHFEKPFAHNWKTLQALRKAGKVDAKGYVII